MWLWGQPFLPVCLSYPGAPLLQPIPSSGLSAPGSESVLGQGGWGSVRSLPAATLSVPLFPGADSSLLGKDSPPTPTMYKYRPGYSSSSSSAALPHSTSAKVRLSPALGTSLEGMPLPSWEGFTVAFRMHWELRREHPMVILWVTAAPLSLS